MSQRNPLKDPKMNQEEFFTNLPSEIVINILSRLPAQSIISCMCVCKSWRCLVETHEFAKSHLAKSARTGFFQSEIPSGFYQIYEFEDGLDLEHHDLHYKLVLEFDFLMLQMIVIEGSADGLLFIRNPFVEPDALYICNPITREHIKIPCPQDFVYYYPQVVNYGFGASKMTGQHKVVRIFQECLRNQEGELLEVTEPECQVYTLGMGSWRSIAPGAPFEYPDPDGPYSKWAFLNGNLHWLVFDLNDCPRISCFDLETELFSSFSSPLPGRRGLLMGMFALGDCLCFSDNTSDDVIVIWLMKEYGVEKSWTKEFVIGKCPDDLPPNNLVAVRPIKVFKDGDILMAWGNFILFYYSKKNNTTQKTDMFEVHPSQRINAILHTSSFWSLKSLL